MSWNEAIGLYEMSRLEPRLHLDDALAAELLAAARMGVRAVELATTGTLDGFDQRWWIANVDGCGNGGHFIEFDNLRRLLGVGEPVEEEGER